MAGGMTKHSRPVMKEKQALTIRLELLRRNMLYLVRWLAPKRPVAQKIKVLGKL
jgi:hypothetical protein